MKYLTLLIVTILSLSCGTGQEKHEGAFENRINAVAEQYVKLALRIGQLDSDYVDAYSGPEEWKPQPLEGTEPDSLVNGRLRAKADSLLHEIQNLKAEKVSEPESRRLQYLSKQLIAAKTRLAIISGVKLSFDEESKALYDAVAPSTPEEHYRSVFERLDKLLPGTGNISERLTAYKRAFIIPKEKLDTVFQVAINECRERTMRYVSLPPDERFTVEYVTNKPWSGYNWYKGNNYSVIQINTDMPVYVERAIDLAAHEGYPGHHVYNLLLDNSLYKGKGWVEYSVFVLFGPSALLGEGTANYGISAAFTKESRRTFEKEVLFPLIGLDAAQADTYYEILALVSELDFAGNDAARNYLDGNWNKQKATQWLITYSLMSPERAENRIQFIEKYRSYVINYNLGQQIVRNYVEGNGGTEEHPERRWELFVSLLTIPQTPSGLQGKQ